MSEVRELRAHPSARNRTNELLRHRSYALIGYTSNVFAILGLRSLYFALAGFMGLFHYLKFGLALILAFVGAKMLLVDGVKIPMGASLGVILGVLALSLAASVAWPARKQASEQAGDEAPRT